MSLGLREATLQSHMDLYRSEMINELRTMSQCQNESKDILVVVHNQLGFVKNCIESIQKHTENYKLWIWDNNSSLDTKNYLEEISGYENINVHYNNVNCGFGKPNNIMAKLCENNYLVLLNSDTQVFEGWDRAMIGHLQANPNCAQVGYQGCLLDINGYGGKIAWGKEIDYVSGFCSCISRATYREFGLFDEIYKFAYCEDSDFSLRLWKAERGIYALHLLLVHHFENRTIQEVYQKGEIDVNSTFLDNHNFLKNRWADYLINHRIEVRKDFLNVSKKL